MPRSSPLFSIVMPTRNRAHLLPFALRSALAQELDDYEIVVVANDCHDRTREVVDELRDDRVRYFETDRMLTMPDNYELAWTKARGQYVTYLPDDDALVPSALRTIADQLRGEAHPIISWEDAPYYYPDWHDPQMRNLLLVSYYGDTPIEDVPAEIYRQQCAQFTFAWSSPLPKIYNCVANRDALESWRAKLGRLFFPGAPDYAFAWIVSHVFDTIRVVHRPLSVRGISDYSAGSNAGVGTAGREFLEEFGSANLFTDVPVAMPTTVNLLAATFLRISPILQQLGITPTPIDQEHFLVAAAKQLQDRECRELLTEREQYFPGLLAAAGAVSDDLRDTVQAILDAPAPEADVESIRDVRDRTARMALEYEPNVDNAVDDHLGEEACARCVLGLQPGILAKPDWDSVYVFGDEIGVSDPHGASLKVDECFDVLMRCRERRRRAIEIEAREPGSTRRTIPQPDDELKEKERIIADLSATAAARLKLIERADADAARAREALERLTADLQEKERVIADLTATAEERLRLVEQASEEAKRARTERAAVRAEIVAKERVIAELTASTAERLQLVQQIDEEATRQRQARERLEHDIAVKERLIAEIAKQSQEKERLIAELTATAEERLRLINQADSVAMRAHDALRRLTSEVQQRDRTIADLVATAEERLLLLHRANAEAAESQEAFKRLASELDAKEEMIAHLTRIAEERLQLIDQLHANAQSPRDLLDNLVVELNAKEQMIAHLSAVAQERLDIIERLSEEAKLQNDASLPVDQP